MLKSLLATPLEKSFVDQLVQKELQNILSVCAPLKVYLFGSAARGEMTDASDLDLLVVIENDVDLKSLKNQYFRRNLGRIYPVDIIFMHETDFQKKSVIGGIAMVCQQEGLIIFEDTRD